MEESKEVEIEICDGVEEYKPYLAVSSPSISSNVIERACLEALGRPWTRSNRGISYDFSEYASEPLGHCELNWCWKGGSTTWYSIFVVVEEVKGTTCAVILGPGGRQLPVIPPSIHVYTFAMRKRNHGALPFLYHSWDSLTLES
jgi:hypothetical protein